MPDEVVIKARGEGFEDLTQKYQNLTNAQQAFNDMVNRSGNQSSAPGANTSLPAGSGPGYPTPGSVEQPTSPMSANGLPPTGNLLAGWADAVHFGGVPRLAPPVTGDGLTYGPGVTNPSAGSSPSDRSAFNGGAINAQNVVINANGQDLADRIADAITSRISTGSGAGTVGGGGGGRGGGGGVPNAAPAAAPDPFDPQPSSSANPNPGHRYFDNEGGHGNLKQFFSDVMSNPTKAGFASALESAGGAGGLAAAAIPGALVGAAGLGVSTAMNAWGAYQRPGYQLDTDLAAMTIRGGYASPWQRQQMEGVAKEQGYLSARQGLLSGAVGEVLTLGGLARPLWDRSFIQPEQRAVAKEQGVLDAQPQLDQLSWLAGAPIGAMTGPNLGVSYALRNQAGMFGMGGVQGLVNSDSAGVMAAWNGSHSTRVSQDMMQSALSTVYSTGSQLGQTNMFNALSSGGNPIGQAYNAANVAISNGDLGSLETLQPLLGADYGRLYSAAVASRGNQVAQQVAQANFSGLQSNLSYAQATGVGMQQQAGMIRGQAGALDPIRQTLEYQLRLSTNDIQRAQIQSQIQGLDAQQAGLTFQAMQTSYQGRGMMIGADVQNTTTGFNYAMYGGEGRAAGGPEVVNGAFDERRRAAERNVRLLREQSQNALYSPEQRAQFTAQANAEQAQVDIGLKREQGQYNIGYAQSVIGVQQANVNAGITNAGLFGGPEAQYNAQMAQVGVLQKTFDLNKQQIDDPGKYGLSQTEVNALRQHNIDIMRQEVQIRTESVRTMLAMNTAIAQTNFGIVQTTNNQQMQFLGVGGQAVAPLAANAARAAQAKLESSRAELAKLDAQGVDHHSTKYTTAQAQVANDTSQRLAQDDALSSAPPTLANRETLLQGSTALNVLTNTFGSYGDIRGITKSMMDATGSEIRDVRANERNIDAQVAKDLKDRLIKPSEVQARKDTLKYGYDQQLSGLTNQLVGEQQQLQTGWMGRLISQTYGMPSRGAYVATGFTQRESAKFTGVLTSAYGTTNVGDRDHWLHYGDALATSNLGIGRSRGFADTALAVTGAMDAAGVHSPTASGASDMPHPVAGVTHFAPATASGGHAASPGGSGDRMMMTPSLSQWQALGSPSLNSFRGTGALHSPTSLQAAAAEFTIHVVLHDGNTGNVVGRGSQKGTIHDINNGAVQVTGNQYTKVGGAHQ